jgi:hypothetical protein
MSGLSTSTMLSMSTRWYLDPGSPLSLTVTFRSVSWSKSKGDAERCADLVVLSCSLLPMDLA